MTVAADFVDRESMRPGFPAFAGSYFSFTLLGTSEGSALSIRMLG
jgi:hypothetical protein